MAKIDITQTAPSEYEVAVEADGVTRHHIRVNQRLRDQLGLPADEDQRLVRESFEFLLEREPAAAILGEFDLDVISRYFPEYETEIRNRLT